ncbi:MAG: multidrug DMT transporter permease [Clostridiales bacterium 38-18]|nr:MAG: multidrug DMT transporter permease [Clostridiales bacterium 38-18]
MWLILAIGSAFFAGITAILSKIGIQNVDSNLATALRTIVVLIFSSIMIFVTGAEIAFDQIQAKTFIFLVLSGVATGASWLSYFRALQLGDVNKVTPIDKSSTVLTMILAIIILGESISLYKVIAIVSIGIGTFLMIQKKNDSNKKIEIKSNNWFLFALASAIFASLTAILGKIGIENINSTLGTTIRTAVVLIMAWGIVFQRGSYRGIGSINSKSWLFLILSGFATGGSWLCFYSALQLGPASIIVPIDKMSLLVTIVFSRIILKERLSKRAFVGLLLMTFGTLILLL